MGERIIVAMSGGVDSSTAAAILKKEGYDTIGIAMQIWDYSRDISEKFGTCCSLEDISGARRVAETIGIPFYVLNLEREFKKEVIDYFVHEYMEGRTPNPCIFCNNKLKFDHLVKYARSMGAEKIATGHYAGVEIKKERYFLKKGRDRVKDQSYYLFNLSQEQLKMAKFPLEHMPKEEVRFLAQEAGLHIAHKKESQEICFIPDNDYRRFVSSKIGEHLIRPGKIVTEKGEVIGEHQGIHNFTVGQRKGLGIPWSTPLYVKRIDPIQNRIVVTDKSGMKTENFHVRETTGTIFPRDLSPISAEVKIRSNHIPQRALLKPLGNAYTEVSFTEPQEAVTPGQAAVFYDGDTVIGGGWIAREEEPIK